ncbi:putative beta-glucanase from glycoside hydrolase family GH16 [Fomitopsis serialis]|uniref:putative beta-glucanase from glycoside hydrolase family GH16 n=1 Tax=Fomitopsis serialis TaxID=139415 RepID=UPI00200883F7|nr:putative beta-glucanase from glycoside hydrolase family GH16 [Neoantrodia serialis]KAH9925579.1 putative beta-glucanase from glycoside hydrolase family GH16 [Neoantrodia serialis]
MGHFRRSILGGLAVGIVAQSVMAGPYTIAQTNVGSDFFNNFQWENISDPTNGRVEYVTKETAQAKNLTYATDDSFVMRADSTTNLTADGPGRMSNRIKSNTQYNTHVAVFDIRHMPQGCGTWPAVWEADDTVGAASGEIDILEGVNDLAPNSVTLHTEGNCTVPSNRTQLGTPLSNDCSDTADIGNGNNGCSVDAPYTSSYGPVFNSNGGGYYAVERTSQFIRVWFWARNQDGIPSDITGGASSVDTDNWVCFGNNNIVIDLTFCGNWAGADFTEIGCGSDCIQYVNENPSAFSDAYWDFAAVRVYEVLHCDFTDSSRV